MNLKLKQSYYFLSVENQNMKINLGYFRFYQLTFYFVLKFANHGKREQKFEIIQKKIRR
jgi:hypothetical protein